VRLGASVIAAAAMQALTPPSWGALWTYTNNGGASDWNTPNDWSPPGPLGPPASNYLSTDIDIAFPGLSLVNQNWAMHMLSFNSGPGGVIGPNLSTTVGIGAGGMLDNVIGQISFYTRVFVNGSQTWTVAPFNNPPLGLARLYNRITMTNGTLTKEGLGDLRISSTQAF